VPAGLDYNGFLSYSHAADGALAPALQRGLQRFAKPWYRTRAITVFRDDTSLSATPQLWSSIAEALDASEFFILLASPTAARSSWVAREAEHWCATKPPERLLVGLTEGTLAWDPGRGDFDWSRTDALPPVLSGAFSEEPRFIDLRWAREASSLALSHPRFRDAVADLAAPLHHVRKEELSSEEVRQHRRTIRITWSAVSLLALLTAAAVVAGLLAVSATRTAVAQQHSAESSALSATSAADLAADYGDAGLFGVESYLADPTTGARSAVVTALEQPTTAILPGHRGPVDTVAFSPGGRYVASGGQDGSLRLWDVTQRRQVRDIGLLGKVPGYVTHNKRESGEVTSVTFSPDGRFLAAAAVIFRFSPGGVALAGEQTTITVWHMANLSHPVRIADPGRAAERMAFSPDGSLLAVAGDDGSVQLWNPSAGTVTASPAAATGAPARAGVSFSRDGRVLAYLHGQSVGFWNVARGGQAYPTLPVSGALAFDPVNPGVLAVTGNGTLDLYNLAAGRLLSSYGVSQTASVDDIAFSPDGDQVAVALDDETPLILVNVEAGFRLGPAETVAGASDVVHEVAYNSASSQVATANEDGTVRVFTVPGLSDLAYVLPGSASHGETAVAGDTVAEAQPPSDGGSGTGIDLWNLATGSHTHLRGPAGYTDVVAVSPDRRLLALGTGDGDVRLVDARTGAVTGKPMTVTANNDVMDVAFSPDGRLIAAAANGNYVRLFDVATQHEYGSPLPTAHLQPPFSTVPGNGSWTVAFSPDGRLLAVGDEAGQVRLWNVATGRLASTLTAGFAPIRAIAFDARSNRLAVIANSTVELWNLTTRTYATLASDPASGSSGLAISPNGSTLASVVGCRLRLWNPATAANIGQPIDLNYMVARSGYDSACSNLQTRLSFAADGSLVVNLGFAGPVYVWSPLLQSTSAAALTRGICSIVNGNLSRSAYSAVLPGEPYHRTCA
jgi:WD40 repeat protein